MALTKGRSNGKKGHPRIRDKGRQLEGDAGGRVVSGHRTQQDAIVVGQREAKRGKVELIIHGRDGRIRSKDTYAVEHRVIKESVGTPSVSRAKIAAAARDVIRAGSASKRRIG